ncbi:thiol reductant ABC exporter subunit CydD [Lysinibacter cavernae]|uniref:ATP-binding cassette subfamily C protein CydD n=1 Tax=Lysinibacter cavernae TaxID=1640652 RepID=A0A7X5TSH8_9MICO|nr:ATP-binding cassette subfamily C protein CydD [Lysinibacter cavernae]
MKPFDARLLRYARSIRGFLARGAALGLLRVASLVGFAWFASQAIVSVVESVRSGIAPESLAANLLGLAASVAVRAISIWLVDANSARGASTAKSELRTASLSAIRRLGPSWLAGRSSASVTTTVTQGLDSLDEYFAKYIPQLIMTALATPILVVIIWAQDWTSAVVILVAYPTIPVFMILIGWATQSVQKKQWQALNTLATSFLDVVQGLSTLKIFGRAERQSKRIEQVTEDYRSRTMKVLRVTFLSGFVLDLAGTLSVAFVAVAIGIRLIEGSLALSVGLFVLLLVPEVFVPIRQVGVSFHAAAEGLAAVEDVFEILDEDQQRAQPDAAEAAVADEAPKTSGLVLRDISVSYGDFVAVERMTMTAASGALTVIVGPSGAGKSSLLGTVTGLVPHTGTVLLDGRPVDADSPADRTWLAWAGQQPGLVAGTIAQNILLGSSQTPEQASATITQVLADVAASDLNPALELGPSGEGLSGGQAQRVAIARALFRRIDKLSRVLLLDEPTSALDSVAEAAVIDALKRIAAEGVAVVVVSHRQAVADRADSVITLNQHVGTTTR